MPGKSAEEMLESLEMAIAGLDAFTRDRFVPASHVINPLLSVWDAAKELGPEVSAPVEAMLTGAVHRNLIETQELRICLDSVRALAVEEALVVQLAWT